jgi:hypothetical protein
LAKWRQNARDDGGAISEVALRAPPMATAGSGPDRSVCGVAGGDDSWALGPRLRDHGALHSDIWEGTAADLTTRHGIAVYPTGGWRR